jgi:folate-dependent phosphoribosylglycinamide formyltransferase PurN
MKVVILTSNNRSGKAVFNKLKKEIQNIEINVIREEQNNSKHLLKRRIKKSGILKVANQLVFQTIIVKLLNFASKSRIEELTSKLDFSYIPNEFIFSVNTVNNHEVINQIIKINPDLVIVSGTRIIKKNIINGIKLCPIVNIHSGITPEYRGVHGMYWALKNKQPLLAGCTLHHVDAGIDTGKIISQVNCTFTSEDSFVTYPLIQLNSSIDLLTEYIKSDFSNGIIISHGVKGKLYYHPGASSYIYNYLKNGLK